MSVKDEYPKLLPEMQRDREGLSAKAVQLEKAGLTHASKRYYAAAAAVRRAYQQLVEHDEK